MFELRSFDRCREGNRLEIKAANGGLPNSMWETYSSFANTYGGCIICGVTEKSDGSWKTTGLKNLPQLKKKFWDQIHNKNKVSDCLVSQIDEYKVGDDVVLVIEVPRANRRQKPIYINNDVFGGTFRRDHEGDYRCSQMEVRAMIRDSCDETADERVLDKKLDFDKESVRSYRIRYNIRRQGSAWSVLSDDDFLVQIGAVNDEGPSLRPTAAGLLMFGKELRIAREYPDYFLDYREHMDSSVRWTDRIHSQEPEWSGNVFDFFQRVSAKLTLDLKKPFKLVNQIRVDETPVHDAVRETLVNCLVNADFYQPWSVVVEKYSDRIIMANPDVIIPGKTQMLKGGVSQPRNRGLFKMFNLIGLGEHAGSGVPDVFKAWKDANLKEPIVEEMFGADKPDRTIVTLPLISLGSKPNRDFKSNRRSKNEINKDQEVCLGSDIGSDVGEGLGSKRNFGVNSNMRSKNEIGKDQEVRLGVGIGSDVGESLGSKPNRSLKPNRRSKNGVGNVRKVRANAETKSKKKELFLNFCEIPRSKTEILTFLGLVSERNLRERWLSPLLKSGELKRTIPDKPRSPKQRYYAVRETSYE